MPFQYTVEAIDVTGDNIPDGDLVSKWRIKADGSKTLVSRKYVRYDVMQDIAKNAATTKKEPAIKTFRGKQPPPTQANEPIQVANASSFGQYVKAGAGITLGAEAVHLGLSALFE
jgi:hypothetical protein